MISEPVLAFLALVAAFALVRLVDCWAVLPCDKGLKWVLSCLIFRKRVYEFRAVLFERIIGGIIFIYAALYAIIHWGL